MCMKRIVFGVDTTELAIAWCENQRCEMQVKRLSHGLALKIRPCDIFQPKLPNTIKIAHQNFIVVHQSKWIHFFILQHLWMPTTLTKITVNFHSMVQPVWWSIEKEKKRRAKKCLIFQTNHTHTHTENVHVCEYVSYAYACRWYMFYRTIIILMWIHNAMLLWCKKRSKMNSSEHGVKGCTFLMSP